MFFVTSKISTDEYVGGYTVLPNTPYLLELDIDRQCYGIDFGITSVGWVDDPSWYTNSNVKAIILEGDHTDKPISYFEGLKSVGQGDKIEVLSRKEDGNLWDGTYEIGSIDVANGVDNSNGTNRKRSFYIPVLPNTNYNVKVCDLINTANDAINIHIYDIDKKPLKWNTINTYNYYITDANEKLITTPSNCRYIKFRTENNRVLNSNSVVISSNTISGNEKYQSDKKQILTTLRSLPNGVKDTIEKRGNKYYKIKRCVECNPREITYFGGKETYCQIELKISDLPQIANNGIISNLFGNFGNTGGSKDTVFVHPTYEKIIVIQTTNPSITTKELAQKYIENNNFTVVYELATPIIEELPNFNPQTFEGNTTLLLNSGVVQAEASFEATNSLGSELEVLKNKVSNNDSSLLLKSDKGHYHSCDENMVTLWKGSLNAISGDITLADSIFNYKALIINVGTVGGGRNTSLTIYPFNIGIPNSDGRIRTNEEMYATLFSGSTPYRYYFKPSSTNIGNLYFEIRTYNNTIVTTNPDSNLFNIRYIMGVK